MREWGPWLLVLIVVILFIIWLYFYTRRENKIFKKLHPDNLKLPVQNESKVKEVPKPEVVKILRCEKCEEKYVYGTLSQTCPKIGCGGVLKEEKIIK